MKRHLIESVFLVVLCAVACNVSKNESSQVPSTNCGIMHNCSMEVLMHSKSSRRVDVFNRIYVANIRTKSTSEASIEILQEDNSQIESALVAPISSGDVFQSDSVGICRFNLADDGLVFVSAPGFQSRLIKMQASDTVLVLSPLSEDADDNIRVLFNDVNSLDNLSERKKWYASNIKDGLISACDLPGFQLQLQSLRTSIAHDAQLSVDDKLEMNDVLDIADSSAAYWYDYYQHKDIYMSALTIGYRVIGWVLDSNNEPIMGATIFVKGTTNGVISDYDGCFEIYVPNKNSAIVVSMIGYVTQETEINGTSQVTIKLASESPGLDDCWESAKTVIGNDVSGAFAGVRGGAGGVLYAAIAASGVYAIANIIGL